MPTKREFKKSVEALSSALADEMMASYYNVEGADRDKISQAIALVVSGMTKAKNDANRFFGKKIREFENVAQYVKAKAAFSKDLYKNIIASYNENLEQALKAYNEGMPKEKA